MTEEEAKTKWCPFVRVVNGEINSSNGDSEHATVQPNYNRVVDGGLYAFPKGAGCIGSACMAWRWLETHVNDPAGGPELVRSTDTHGTCGLAGPQFQNYRNP